MVFQMEWYVEDRVLLTKYQGELTLEELFESNKRTKEMAENMPHAIHNIVDIQELDSYPTSIRELMKLSDSLQDENIRWFIVISTNKMQSFIVNMLGSLFKANVKLVATIEEAMAILKRVDTNL